MLAYFDLKGWQGRFMRLYLIRHGQTILNQKKCYYGVTDVALNEEGMKQAAGLASLFKDISFDYVVSSPLLRAMQTAKLVLDGRDLPIREDDRLMEQNFGIFEGLTYQEVMNKYPEEYEAWNKDFSNYRIPGGESFSDVRARVDSFIRDLPKEGTVLLTAHKGTLGHLTASLLGLSLTGYWNFVFDQDCYSCIDIEDGFAIIRCLNRRS